MQKISILGLVAIGLTLCAAVAYFSVGSVQARPQYVKGFAVTYPDLAAAVQAKKCALCHMGNNKKMRNDYGKAFGAGLPAKNEKVQAVIGGAMINAEGAKNGAGIPFGVLIESGQLPE